MKNSLVIKSNFLKELLLQLFLNFGVFVKQRLLFKDYKDDKEYVSMYLYIFSILLIN